MVDELVFEVLEVVDELVFEVLEVVNELVFEVLDVVDEAVFELVEGLVDVANVLRDDVLSGHISFALESRGWCWEMEAGSQKSKETTDRPATHSRQVPMASCWFPICWMRSTCVTSTTSLPALELSSSDSSALLGTYPETIQAGWSGSPVSW